jgi:excisionase family DNA binding protein
MATTDDRQLTLPEVADLLHVSEASVRRWIKAGRLPAIRVGPGGRFRVALRDLDRVREKVGSHE